jgi:Fimbrial assembly protein (PilN)
MTQQVNLFNPIFLKQKKIFSAVNMADALALLLVGIALFYGYASIETLNLDRQAVETARQYYQSKTRLSQASVRYAPKKPDAALAAEVGTLQAQVNARKATMEDLGGGVFGGGSDYAEYMRALARQSLAGLWLTGFSIGKGGAEMEISGRALRPELVPSYIQRLTQERVLQGRAFDSLSMTQHDGTLPADASRPGTTPAKYVYTEFRLVSSQAVVPAGSTPRPEQTRNGGAQ